MAQRPSMHIGTSGWSYDHWVGHFYPEELPIERRLDFYAHHLRSVEINTSFYRLPERRTLERWRDTVPRDFLFTAKASRYITHMKKLKDPIESLTLFFNRMSILGDRLGPILFQLPPRWRFNAERFELFLSMLSTDFRYVFELRDTRWINDQAFDLLARFDASFCIFELNGFLAPPRITTDFVYVRLHGPDGPYQGCYQDRTLANWSTTILDWSARNHRVYCYFDNDQMGYAVHNALRLQSMLRGT